jgi:hypothetical protein
VQIDGLEALAVVFNVSVDDFEGSYAQNISGALQDSVLGPLLFLLVIEDLSQITLFGNLRLFADDNTALLYSERKLVDEK